MESKDDIKVYNKDFNEVIEYYESSIYGLSEEEAKIRLKKDGYNKLEEAKKTSFLKKIINQFKDFMTIILIIAAILSAIVSMNSNEPITDSIIIFFVVILNAILGILQESKAEKAIDALKQMSIPYIKVKRNGSVESIKVEELVVGDIVIIEAGDYVPADMRIIQNHSLKVDESALTGESMPVEKSEMSINSKIEVPIAERNNMVYSGTSIVYGRGEGIVIGTGMNTEIGKIAFAISSNVNEITPLQKKLNKLSELLSIIVIIISVIMFLIGCIRGNNILDVFMLAVSLAVAAIPEGLSAVITITLAMGVQKMAKQKAIVRKLSAVETLGSTEIICSDKTGTLTQNKMTVRKVWIEGKVSDINDGDVVEHLNKNIGSTTLDIFSKAYVLCNDSVFTEEDGNKTLLGDPTETSLIEFGEKFGYDKEKFEEEYLRIDEIPFDSTRKMMTTVNEIEDGKYIFSKGAVESILNSCNKIFKDGKEVDISDDDKKKILQQNLDFSKDALRVLAFAYKKIDEYENVGNIKEDGLTFIGMMAIIDPPREEAKVAIKECITAGMTPIMITGDNVDTAYVIAKELGILETKEQAITGIELDNMTDEELEEKIKNIKVYARVSPENKLRIVKMWKKLGKVVAMTGDGVNDAPALKTSDIGVGMGITGTEVSKNVSSIVLADDNFATIILAVKEGRRIYNNIQNVIVYLLASNLAEVLLIFLSTIFNKIMLYPIQILWINLISDTLPAIALGFEKEERGIMKNPPRNKDENFLNRYINTKIIVFAVIKVIAMFVLYRVIENINGIEYTNTAVFIALSVIEILFAYVSRKSYRPIYYMKVFENKVMFFSILLSIAMQSSIIFIPSLAKLFKLKFLDTSGYIALTTIIISTIVILDVLKVIISKAYRKMKN